MMDLKGTHRTTSHFGGPRERTDPYINPSGFGAGIPASAMSPQPMSDELFATC